MLLAVKTSKVTKNIHTIMRVEENIITEHELDWLHTATLVQKDARQTCDM